MAGGLLCCCASGVGFDASAQFPEEGTEFTGYGNFDFVAVHPALAQGFESCIEPQLGAPGKLAYPPVCSGLSARELCADFGRFAVVGGLLDEQPACVGVARFADRALAAFGAAGVFGRNETEKSHELFWMLEAAEGADLADGDHGGDDLEAFECHHGIDQRLALPVFQQVEHFGFEFVDALVVEVDDCQVVLEHDVVGAVWELEAAQVVHVGLGPVGFAVVAVTEPTQHGQQSRAGAA